MQKTITQYIERECHKQIRRFHQRNAQAKRVQTRFKKRTGRQPGLPANDVPPHWSLSNQFHPFRVRSRAEVYAHAISKAIRSETYSPQPCLVQHIPKATGGTRPITVFAAADAAVATYLYERLLERNAHLLSSHAYAYRRDRNAHHAIQHISSRARGSRRKFVLEYDFKDYFGSISHKYLLELLNRFKVSPRELRIIEAFLRHRYADSASRYRSGVFSTKDAGIPQGSSISLFLANVACHDLDMAIESTGAAFARYADDTVIICDEYDQAAKCANLMLSHGDISGTVVNLGKSDGVSLLTQETLGEMSAKVSIDFLGHSISQARVDIAKRSVFRIKKKIGSIVHRNLILYPQRGQFVNRRIENAVDWDVVTCLNEIRSYLYGRNTEQTISECLEDPTKPLSLGFGLLSFYPLVDDVRSFRMLDGWLLNVLMRAQRRRHDLISEFIKNYTVYTEAEWLSGDWYDSQIDNESKIPSFVRGWRYVRKSLNVYGLQEFPTPPYEY